MCDGFCQASYLQTVTSRVPSRNRKTPLTCCSFAISTLKSGTSLLHNIPGAWHRRASERASETPVVTCRHARTLMRLCLSSFHSNCTRTCNSERTVGARWRVLLCVYVLVPRGRNSAQDSFIKCAAASQAVVNHFYFLCVGGQLC